MSKLVLDVTDDNNALVGDLTRHTVMQITKKNIKRLVSSQSSIIDLQKVADIDTAGLAWLFYLLEQASNANCQLSFSNVPDKLHKLISLSDVDGFLPIHV